ncbi:hypothetical protein, partial [Pseudomonas aeruginosa]
MIKEIDANKHERVLQRPRIAAQINTQAEWRQLHIVKEGALEKSRSGYIVAIHPYAVPGKRQSEKAVTFDLVVDQLALLQRLAAVRGRLSLCADQAAAA